MARNYIQLEQMTHLIAAYRRASRLPPIPEKKKITNASSDSRLGGVAGRAGRVRESPQPRDPRAPGMEVHDDSNSGNE